MTAIYRWFIVLTIGFGSFCSLLSSTSVEVIFPHLMSAIGMELSVSQWTVTVYMIAMTLAMFLAGDGIKRFGTKKVFNSSFVLLILGAALSGSADSVPQLMAGRILQGAAAGLQAPIATIVMARIFPREQLGFAMGMFGAVMLMAPALGPVFGGIIVEFYDWRLVFYMQIPLAILSLFLGAKAIPQDVNTLQGSYDWTGFLLISVSISCFFVSLAEAQKNGLNSQLFLAVALLFAVAMALFIANEKRVSKPLLDLKVFQNRYFNLYLLIIFFTGMGLFSSVLIIPYYLQNVLQLSAQQVGQELFWTGLIMAILAPVSGRLSDKYNPIFLVIIGLLLFASSALLLSQLPLGAAVSLLVMYTILGRIGLSVLLPAIYTSCMRELREGMLENGSVMMNLARQVGGAFGVLYFSLYFEHRSYIASSLLGHQLAIDNIQQSTRFFEFLQVPSSLGLTANINAFSGHLAFMEIFYLVGFMSVVSALAIILAYALGRHRTRFVSPS